MIDEKPLCFYVSLCVCVCVCGALTDLKKKFEDLDNLPGSGEIVNKQRPSHCLQDIYI